MKYPLFCTAVSVLLLSCTPSSSVEIQAQTPSQLPSTPADPEKEDSGSTEDPVTPPAKTYDPFQAEKAFGVGVHSHNDYAQERPFWGAYEAGAISIEADIWMVNRKIYVAHDREDITEDALITQLYLDPIKKVMADNGGRAYADGRPLQLLVDLKNGKAGLDKLVDIIQSGGYAQCFDRVHNPYAVRLLISGDAVEAKDFTSYPDFIFFDGRPGRDYTAGQLARVPLISQARSNYTSWSGIILPLPETDAQKIRADVEAAAKLGCGFRVWSFPDTELGWKTALSLGVSYINSDKPADAVKWLAKQKN